MPDDGHEWDSQASSQCIKTAPQFPHLHSTAGLGVSSTGGALGHRFNDQRRRHDLEGLL
jgi:hypothetical protein